MYSSTSRRVRYTYVAKGYTFRGNSALALNDGIINQTLVARTRHFDVGKTVNYILNVLRGKTFSRVNTTLINVTYSTSAVTVGIKNAPPINALPTGKSIYFTFALKYTNDYQADHVALTSLSTSEWGSLKDSRQ